MAESPAHKLGQIIGDSLEQAVRNELTQVVKEFGLYLDFQRPRAARDGKRKVTWQDTEGNTHDLDYVIEEGGSDAERGSPRAFVEIAWRRYTKHSRNKVQEIQGAVLPVARAYQRHQPFKGAILGGDFTEAARRQLRSHGFVVAHCSYDMIVSAFGSVGVDVSSDSDTPDSEARRKVRAFERLTPSRRKRLGSAIRSACAADLDAFFAKLRLSLSRRLEHVLVLALSKASREFVTVEDAVRFIQCYEEFAAVTSFDRYELQVRYSNGDEIRGAFASKAAAVDFLRSVEP